MHCTRQHIGYAGLSLSGNTPLLYLVCDASSSAWLDTTLLWLCRLSLSGNTPYLPGCLQFVCGTSSTALIDTSLFWLHRLQNLENLYKTVIAEVDTVKQQASGVEDWRQKVDDASTQVASVLDELHSRFEAVRCDCTFHVMTIVCYSADDVGDVTCLL